MNEKSLVTRTSDTHAPEMLVRALRVVAGSTRRFKRTQRLVKVNLVTVCHGQEAALDIVREVGVVAIGLEHAKGTFIRSERRWLRLFFSRQLALSA